MQNACVLSCYFYILNSYTNFNPTLVNLYLNLRSDGQGVHGVHLLGSLGNIDAFLTLSSPSMMYYNNL